ncbi:hypothetical protein D3C72_1102400 [compost metagenome]
MQGGAYAGHMPVQELQLVAGAETVLAWDPTPTAGWYDLIVRSEGVEQRLAGRAEDGRPGTSDPAMGTAPLRFEHG